MSHLLDKMEAMPEALAQHPGVNLPSLNTQISI